MKGEIWITKICDGVLDWNHGNFRSIHEVYIPKKKITFNAEGDGHCFKSGRNRYNEEAVKIGDIEVPDQIVNKLLAHIKNKKLDDIKKWFNKELSNAKKNSEGK